MCARARDCMHTRMRARIYFDIRARLCAYAHVQVCVLRLHTSVYVSVSMYLYVCAGICMWAGTQAFEIAPSRTQFKLTDESCC